MKYKILILALAASGEGISGSDRIFIELSRRWSKKFPVEIVVWDEGFKMCQRMHLNRSSNLLFHIANLGFWGKNGFLISYLSRIAYSVYFSLNISLSKDNHLLIYSASEFWMDSIPAFIIKMRYSHNSTWIAAWYQTAPKPWIGFSQGQRKQNYKLSALFYWLAQFPIKPIIAKFADFVLVNNEEEKKLFSKLSRSNRAVVVSGAVNLEERDKYRRKFENLPKVFDCVFQGRFHPQKGVIELIDIWKRVIVKKPNARLAMIGDGPLMEKVQKKIIENNLEKNVKLFGYVFDGSQKYKIFCQSKIVAHPAFYDSGGMAAAEAMMFGLPCVGFNLISYQYYYPHGMIKVKVGDLDAFSSTIQRLLNDEAYRQKIAREAVKMIEQNWSWDKRAEELQKTLVK